MAKKEFVLPEKPKRVYIRNKDLLAEIIKCRENDMQMSDKLANMIIMLTARYGRSGRFSGYTFNEDMQGHAVMMLCKTWTCFNPERGDNPFAYFTQCIKSSFKQILNKEKRQRVVRDELLVSRGLNPSFTYTSEHSADDQHHVHDEEDFNQNLDDMQDVNSSIEANDKVE